MLTSDLVDTNRHISITSTLNTAESTMLDRRKPTTAATPPSDSSAWALRRKLEAKRPVQLIYVSLIKAYVQEYLPGKGCLTLSNVATNLVGCLHLDIKGRGCFGELRVAQPANVSCKEMWTLWRIYSSRV